MTYDPNREPRNVNIMNRDGGMWGWIVGIAAVIDLGLVVWAAVDSGPQVADKGPQPVTQPAGQPGTVGSAPSNTTSPSGSGATTGAAPAEPAAPRNAPAANGATRPGNAKQ